MTSYELLGIGLSSDIKFNSFESSVGVYETVKAFIEGEEIGGKERVYGLKEDGVGIPESTKNLVPQDIIDYVNEMAEKVKNGEIKVPATKDEYEAMNK